MTKVFKEDWHLSEKVLVVAQEYANKPNFIKFWRYRVYVNNIQVHHKDMLTSKPDTKKIARRFKN